MDYKEFKEKMLEELQGFYGDSAEVDIVKMQKYNGVQHDGIRIRMKGDGSSVMPVIRLDELHEEYYRGGMEMEDCVQAALQTLKDNEIPEGVERFTERIRDWSYVRENVYPILLSTEDNQELLQTLVSVPMLDLSVAYIIRLKTMGGFDGSIKMSGELLEIYGISKEQLHKQAMENLVKDGYKFQDLYSLIWNQPASEGFDEAPVDGNVDEKMYVLTNASSTFGAAGILNKELLKKFAGEQDYFILPSSIHETLFVPANGRLGKEAFDDMVSEMNGIVVRAEEKLADHSYYYDAKAGEIRMCA